VHVLGCDGRVVALAAAEPEELGRNRKEAVPHFHGLRPSTSTAGTFSAWT
jgi:hypothetical protein